MNVFNVAAFRVFLACIVPYFCSGQSIKPVSVNIPQLIDSIALSLNRHYIFPQEAHRMSAFLQNRAQQKAYAPLADRPEALVKQLQTDLSSVCHDPHLFVDYNPAFAASAPGSPASAEEEMRQAKKYWKANNYLFEGWA